MDHFCVLPFYGRELSYCNKDTHCCQLPLEYDVKSIQQAIFEGRRAPECQKCWNLEDQGLVSDRILKNQALDFYWNKDIEQIKKEVLEESWQEDKILMLKLLTSFTCNATCIMCNEKASSSWNALTRNTDRIIPIQSYKSVDIDRVKSMVNFKELKTLILIGGEPLYEKRNFELLEYILELGNNDLFLSFTTNGSVLLNKKQKETLSKFKNVNFCLSMDGVGPMFEYQRFPLEWQLFKSNFKFFQEITDNISASYTITNVNVWEHQETVAWFNKHAVPYITNPVYGPAWFQPRSLPVELKKELKTMLNSADYNLFIGDNHSSNDDNNFKIALKELDRQDNLKKIQLKDYAPKVAERFNLYR